MLKLLYSGINCKQTKTLSIAFTAALGDKHYNANQHTVYQ